MRETAGRWWGPHFTRLVSGLLASVALLVAVVGVAVLAFLLPSIGSGVADPWSVVALVVFLVTVVVVAVLGARLRRAALETGRLTEEQSALRRVATLVAQSVPASAVFEAVTQEVGLLCGGDLARMERYEEDGTVTGVAAWARVSDQLVVGTRFRLDGLSVARDVRQTGAPVRVESFAGATGDIAREAHELGIRSSVGCPIVVAGQLWGVIAASTTRDEPFPANTETQIGSFTELVATAIANAQARQELQGFAEEQAALRRVATLVARAAAPEEVFAAVAAEVGRVLSADHASMARYDAGGTATVVGTWSEPGFETPFPVDLRLELGGWNTPTLVFETGRPARIDYGDASGAVADAAHERGIRSSVGAPISVEGRLWGLMGVLSTQETSLPADTEARLADFTELVATAIANAESRAALTASRARIVTAADTTRRHLERDLHDGAQQRLVSLALHLRGLVQDTPPQESDQLRAELDQVADGLTEVLDELREIARGIHPTALAEGGLRPALKGLARRSVVPVRLEVDVDERLSEPIELAAYYVVAEALTNATKHADASVVDVRAETDEQVLQVRVHDDGRGGADTARGTGLVGLTDRVEALGGRLSLHSPPGAGTTMQVALPLTAAGVPGPAAVATGRPDHSGTDPAVGPRPSGPADGG
jgi:signal transduction histidine kinase